MRVIPADSQHGDHAHCFGRELTALLLQMQMFGWMGAMCCWVGIPVLLLLDRFGWEPFEWPSYRMAAVLLANGLLGCVVPDLLWARAVVLGSPSVATIGLSLTIPMSIAFDAFREGSGVSSNSGVFSTPWTIGTALIWLAFIGVDPDGDHESPIDTSYEYEYSYIHPDDTKAVAMNRV